MAAAAAAFEDSSDVASASQQAGGPLNLDLSALSTAISNSDDLGPYIRRAFAVSRQVALQDALRLVARTREAEIEELCRAHFHDFIRAVDDLRSLLTDADRLKTSLSASHSLLLSSSAPLLVSLESFLAATAVSANVAQALLASRRCVRLLSLASRANTHLAAGPKHLFLALRAVADIDRDLRTDPSPLPLPPLRRMLLSLVPAVRAHAEREISREFADWMVQIRAASRHLGQVAIGRAAAARQKDEEIRSMHRAAEESAAAPISFALDLDGDVDDFAAAAAAAEESAVSASFDLTPLYRAMHIHQTLSLDDRFKC